MSLSSDETHVKGANDDLEGADSNNGPSLTQLYARAQQLVRQLDTLQATFDSYSSSVRAAIEAVNRCRHGAARISLFSPNESLEDVTTSSLKYLTLDADLGDLLQKPGATSNPSTIPSSEDPLALRKSAISAAQDAYSSFLALLDRYNLLSAAEIKAHARFLEDKNNFSVVSATTDPAARRVAKIARMREEKAVRAQLDELRAKASAKAKGDQQDEQEEDDDDAARTLALADIRLRIMNAFQSLDMIGQELRVLATAPSFDQRARQAASDPRQLERDHRLRTVGSDGTDGYSDRLDSLSGRGMLRNGGGGPILDSRGKPLQPFTLLDRRTEMRQGVFRPGHNLPTMSIDEYLEEERRRGGIIEGGGDRPAPEPNEDDYEKADAETMKQREWDEFKEENPRGSGNTLNRG